MFLPAIFPARNGHTGRFMAPVAAEIWIVAGATIIACFSAALFAIRTKRTADIVAATVAGLITLLFGDYDL
jgi:hypothetical protein